MAYTTATLIGNYLQRTLTANESSYLAILIPAIKIWIDKKLGTTFDTAVASTRYYDGGVTNLDIDPCNTITAVSALNSDGTIGYAYDLVTTPEVVYEPVNETVKREIRKRYGQFPRGKQNIAVTAVFSEYDATNSVVPEDIQNLATIMASEVLNQGNLGSSGAVASESVEGHSITYDTSSGALDGISDSNPSVASILANRRELFVG